METDLEQEANRVSDEQYLRRRWRKLLPAMKAEVRKAAEDARGLGYARPLKVGPLPTKGVPENPRQPRIYT